MLTEFRYDGEVSQTSEGHMDIVTEENEVKIPQYIYLQGRHMRLESYSTKRLQELMEEKGWNQSQMAKHSGVPQTTISSLLAGADPRVKTLKGLGRAFNVIWIADWITPEEEKSPAEDGEAD